MKDIQATATGVSQTPIDQCFALLREIEKYPDWYPDGAKSVDVLERDADGAALKVDAVLAAVAGPLRKSFDVRLTVLAERPTRIALARVADDRGDHEALTIAWSLRELSPAETEVTVEMVARLDLPPFLPIDPVAREAANGFLQAALTSF
jgi:ribosome-associated toxin RatA of RatAB toxin-antitoxin module